MKKILVIGDSCTDIFQYGKCERLSPEAPVPIFKPTNITTNGGMSINVAENIRSLGAECNLVTNDLRPAKTRYVDETSNQILLRVDVNDEVKEIDEDLLIQIKFDEYDAVVISDYNKGFLSKDDIEFISKNHPVVFMDTKKELGLWAENVRFIKLNEKEFEQNTGREFRNKYMHYLIVTKGGAGAELNNSRQFPIKNEHPVRDLSGAGDTFLAALVVEYLKSNNMEEAIHFANKCSSWVVTKKGVVSVNPELI